MSPRLGAVLARLDVTADPVPLAGGTNATTYRVGGLVVRLLRGDGAVEADRARKAAVTGAAPPVYTHLPELGALVVEHVAGRPLTDTDLRDPDVLRRTAASLRRLHGGGLTGRVLDLRSALDSYARAPGQPAGWAEHLPQVRARVDALTIDAAPVLCHGDLVAANLLDDGQRVWLVDLDDAVDADPAYDVANLWVQAGLDDTHLATLCTAYGPLDVERVRRWALVVAYTWTAWSRLRVLDPVPVDYDPLAFGDRLWGYARQRL